MPLPFHRPDFGPPGRPRPLRRPAFSAPANTGAAPGFITIPFSWIATPIVRKPTTAITKAQISQSGGATAYASATPAQVRQYGVNSASTTLDTDCDADPLNLAAFLTTYESIPRPRQPTLTFHLLARTDDECLTLLGVKLAQRVRIVEAPAGTPPGALNFTVEGIRHIVGVEQRDVIWSTAALVGVGTSAPGPWFRLGISATGGTDRIPF